MNYPPVAAIIALGNPEPDYASHRHNVGCRLLDCIAARWGAELRYQPKHQGYRAQVRLADHKVLLFRPHCYMNQSGLPVAAALRYWKIAAEQALVLHDELDLPIGHIRLKTEGGSGGHNGLKDLLRHTHNATFKRVRIGIDHPRNRFGENVSKEAIVKWVLSAPSQQDLLKLERAYERFVPLTEPLIQGDWAVAMKALHTSDVADSHSGESAMV